MYPILEFDPEETALIDPAKTIKRLPEMPERCVLCFFNEACVAKVWSGQFSGAFSARTADFSTP